MFKKITLSFTGLKKLFGACIGAAKKIPWILGRNAFSFILILILLDVLLVEFLFYKYVVIASIKEPEGTVQVTTFKENTYRDVILQWQTRGEMFSESLNQTYSNPFQ